MATINVKMVVGRYSMSFESHRKTLDSFLATTRKFFVMIGEEKKTSVGKSTTCSQIVSFFPEVVTEIEQLKKERARLKEECDNCMYYDEVDAKNGSARHKLSKKLNALVKYVEHFQSLVQNRGPDEAAKSAIKHKKEVIKLIDSSVKANKAFGRTIANYIKSQEFRDLVAKPDSYVAIKPSELTGTKQQRREFLAQLDARALAELQAEKRADKQFVETGNRMHGPAEPVDEADLGEIDIDDDEEDDAPEVDEDIEVDENGRIKRPPRTVNSDDSGGSESSSSSSDEDEEAEGGGGDEESGEMSQGAVLFENNLENNNKHVLEEVEQKAIVRNGRAFRPRQNRLIDLEAYGEDAARKPIDEDEIKKRAAKKRKVGDDEAAGSEMSESSEDEINVEAKRAFLEAQRALDEIDQPPPLDD